MCLASGIGCSIVRSDSLGTPHFFFVFFPQCVFMCLASGIGCSIAIMTLSGALVNTHTLRTHAHCSKSALCLFLQCVAVCCSVLRCVAVCCSVLWCVFTGCCSVFWKCFAVCCSVLQGAAVCVSQKKFLENRLYTYFW